MLLAVDGYRYNGRDFDRRETVERIAAETGGEVVTLGYLATIPVSYRRFHRLQRDWEALHPADVAKDAASASATGSASSTGAIPPPVAANDSGPSGAKRGSS